MGRPKVGQRFGHVNLCFQHFVSISYQSFPLLLKSQLLCPLHPFYLSLLIKPISFNPQKYLSFLFLNILFGNLLFCFVLLLCSAMELQLGLALPGINTFKGFDLNNIVYEPRELDCSNSVKLGGPCFFTSSVISSSSGSSITNRDTNNKKRRFSQAFNFEQKKTVPRKTLSLLLWNQKHNGEDDDPEEDYENSLINMTKNGGDCLVGWPPVKSLWRKRHCFHSGMAENNMVMGNNINGCRRISNSMFVKVKVEGVAIARKIDISLHHSFQSLVRTLMDMFEILEEDSNVYKLAYQDREGDWLHAEDVPWRTFKQSVQRLKLVRRNLQWK